MFLARIAFAGMFILLSTVSSMAQTYVPGVSPAVRPVGAQPYPMRPSLSVTPGNLGPRTRGLQYGFSYGYGSDYYSGYYYRPYSDFGYFYLGSYYPNAASVSNRTPLSAPPPGVVPISNLTGTSSTSPDYTYPELINPSMNPTIRPKK